MLKCDPQRQAYGRAYRIKNAESIRAYQRAYDAARREKRPVKVRALLICNGCGIQYAGRAASRKYCSRACFRKYGHQKPGRGRKCKCKICGVDFFFRHRRQYCEAHESIGRMAGLTKCWKRERIKIGTETPCRTCGKLIYNCPSEHRVFCSKKCFVGSGGPVRAGLAAIRMMSMYGAKKDANHKEVVDFLRKTATPFIDLSSLGCGIPDLVVSLHGALELWEIKNPKTSYGRKGLNPNQKAWADNWRGSPVRIIRNIDEAIARVNGPRVASENAA